MVMDKSSVFDLNASWLLQNTVGVYQKADSLYEGLPRCNQERQIISECKRRGLATTDQDLWVVRMAHKPDLVAVGTCGKRSTMMALVVAAAINGGSKITDEVLDEMDMKKAYEKLMTEVKRINRSMKRP